MVRGASRRSSGSFGSNPGGRKSRGALLRDQYSLDRYPTPEDFIAAVERNPELYDPGSMEQGKVRYSDTGNGRGVGYSDLKGVNKSNWIEDNPIDVDVETDPGSISVAADVYSDDSGNTVSLVAGLDLIPMGIDINVNGDVGTVAVDLGMPGDAIGVTVGASFDTETGEVIGGQLGLAGGGLSVNVNQIRKDGETCATITVTYMGIGTAYQRCRKDEDDDEKDPKKDPPPGPGSPVPPPPPLPPPPITQIPGDQNRYCIAFCFQHLIYYRQVQLTGTGNCTGLAENTNQTTAGSTNISKDGVRYSFTNVYKNTIDTRYDKDENYSGAGYITRLSDGRISWSLTSGGGGGNLYMFEGSVAYINTILARYTYYPQVFSENTLWQFSSCPHKVYSGASMWLTPSVYFPDTGETWNPPPPPPPPPPPKEPEPPIPPEDPVTCCDLEPVMSLLRKVSAAIGVDDLPANMPKSFLQNEGIKTINNLAELQVYHLEIMDQLIGKFPIEMEIADTDPLSPGDQTKKVVLTNLAESIAELFGLAINGASDNAIQTSGSIKNLLEITLVRQAVLQNYYKLDAILDYLGAGLEEDEAVFNSTISLPKDPNNISEDIADFLQQSEIKFAYDKLANPKDTLTAKLLPIQKAADIIKAKYWKGFGKAGGDYLGAIKSWLATYDPKNDQNETDWKDKLDKILEEYAKDPTGNIDKDKMPVIQNISQIGSEPTAPGT